MPRKLKKTQPCIRKHQLCQSNCLPVLGTQSRHHHASQEYSVSANASEVSCSSTALKATLWHCQQLVLDNHLHVNQTGACSDYGWNWEWGIFMICLLLQLTASVHRDMFTECVSFTAKSSHSRAQKSTDLRPFSEHLRCPAFFLCTKPFAQDTLMLLAFYGRNELFKGYPKSVCVFVLHTHMHNYCREIPDLNQETLIKGHRARSWQASQQKVSVSQDGSGSWPREMKKAFGPQWVRMRHCGRDAARQKYSQRNRCWNGQVSQSHQLPVTLP